ncbi:Ig domain-containing protein [uncultured Empedobacter sp.]|uniref:Ig domain-containing protein n=1 Tax=uncultured Empedobacter sp. TaxID=410844 RepID=UPI0025D47CF9|nr:Ig domain-containing protein [uncultured Empedobacter sp.]
MKKFYLFNWILLLIGLVSYNALGQTTVNYTFNGVSGNIDENISYTTEKNSASTAPAFTGGNLRLYVANNGNGGSITLNIANNVKITSVIFKGVSGNTVNAKYFVDETSTSTSISASNNNYTIQNLNAITSLKFQHAATTGQIRLTGLTLTYENIVTDQPPVVSSKTITGTYGVLLTDGTITATNNPTSWAQTGTLPLGITFENGVFSGTPTQTGTFRAEVTATNEHGTSDAANVTFEIAKANQTVNYTFEDLTQNQGTTFTELPNQTDQGQNIVYTSADNSIVSANGNTLSFDGIGSTTITATAVGDNNFNDYTTTFNVKSNDPNVITYNGEGTFVKINNLEEVTNGYYVFSYENKAMNNTLNSGKFGVQNITTENNRIINPSLSIVWKIDNVNNGLAISNEEIGSYINYTTSTNFSLIKEPSTDNSKWSASFSNEGFLLRNVNSTDRGIIYRTTDVFGAYAITNLGGNEYKTLQLYKLLPSNSTTWDGTAWSNGTPDLTKEVILHATPTESFSAKKLTVERDMIIPAGITITVENEVVNQNDVTFRFSHGAYLIQKNNSAVNVGPAMFDRSSTPIYRLENLMWSSPVINQNIFEISPNTLTNRFARFLESTNDWTENVTAADNFKAGELISFRAPNNYNNYGEGDAQVFESSFRGQLFNGEVTIPVTKASKGNNAVGNPYASPLSLDALIAANTSVGVNSVYVWTHSKPIVNGAYQGSNWAIYNGTGWNDNSVTSQNIDIAQGFIVKVANAGNLVLNNAMRTSANGPVYYKEQKDRYWLSLSNNQGKINSSLIGYVNGSTNKFDQNFDAQPFDNNNEGLYSVLNNDLFVIQGRGDFNNEDSFDLTFNVKKAGTYQINLEQFEGVFENQNIYLVDKKLDKVFNLNELKSYSFDTEAGEINDRFSINYQNKTLSTNDLSKKGLVVYAQNKQITISSKESIKSIKLVDISGRQLQNIQNINTKNYVINLNVNPQVVVVVVENTNGTIESRKVILK